MKTQLQILLLLILWLTNNNLFGQKHALYNIESRIITGQKNALFEIAVYFDSPEKITEYLGYHIMETTESQVAKRIVEENCIFTKNEILISNNTTAKEFITFLKYNENKILFSRYADAFILTPLELRTAKVEFREMSQYRKTELKKNFTELLKKDWVRKTQIKSLIAEKDPKVLLFIASELYKIRYRFNIHHFNENEYIELLQSLTNIEIGVENAKNEQTWHIDKEFEPNASLNLLIYFSSNYSKFIWDDKDFIFKNPEISTISVGKEETLFQILNNENDSIALDAFSQLTTCDLNKVVQLSKEYEQADIETNNALPTFPFRFLKQLVKFTDYCKKDKIDFIGSKQLSLDIKRLDSDLIFKDRRMLEDSLINKLTLKEITAFEYWALIQEHSWGLTYSAGRILDIFYSKNWNQLLTNEMELKLYLKKSKLFDDIGIIGICNNYLRKFTNLQSMGIEKLNQIPSDDSDINEQIIKAKSFCTTIIKRPDDKRKINDANQDYNIDDIETKIREIVKLEDAKKKEDSLTELLSQINYNQLGIAIRVIENIEFTEYKWKKYSFLERDWGFFLYKDFDTITARNEFLKLYDKFSEYELYTFFLNQAGISYKNKDKSLDYDKIYDILKYNVVTAFTGGGGGKKDNEVYSIIKILELTQNTTLGYPKKLCNSNGIYGCDSQDRAKEWIQYLIDNKLLKEQNNEPVSFHHE
jgi:hypothetical protein